MESVHSISHYLQCHYSHLGFGGSLGHVQGAAASAERGGGSKGSGRADQEGGNNELHLGYAIDGWKWVKGGWSGIMDYGLFFWTMNVVVTIDGGKGFFVEGKKIQHPWFCRFSYG